MSMSIIEKQKQLIEDFELFDDWEQKYEYIIELGKNLPAMSEDYKIDENLIKGCQSRVWFFAEKKENKIIFYADSDGILPKGIIAMLISIFSGATSEEILASDTEFLSEIGLQEFLSPTRANGLVSMIKQIKMYALALQTK